MTIWKDSIEVCKFEFVEELERRGFRANGRTLSGNVGDGDTPTQIQIELTDDFPFVPPAVSPPNEFPRSWHRELDGRMCLYPSDGRDDLPWLDVDNFLTTVSRWINESQTGWTDDFPDLDLERYFPSEDEQLVVYEDLDQVNNKFIQLRRGQHLTRVTGPGSAPKGKSVGKNRCFGFVADIGEPVDPPTNWDTLKAMIAPDDAKTIERAIHDHRLEYLIIKYSRGSEGAAVVLKASSGRSGGIDLASVRSASEASRTLTLRAGSAAACLAEAQVAVVGVGAIGSFVCDLLARAGVGAITAYDPDIVRPGNLIRHLAGPEEVGLAKPVAVKRIIEARPFNRATIIKAEGGLHSWRDVETLLEEHDVVIDASASGSITQMLAEAAIRSGHRLISVCLQEEGNVVRVDLIPPLDGDPIPPTELGAPPPQENLRFEAGCGDPVSQTPAFAVLEAASLATRHAVGLLTGSPVSNAGTIRDYR